MYFVFLNIFQGFCALSFHKLIRVCGIKKIIERNGTVFLQESLWNFCSKKLWYLKTNFKLFAIYFYLKNNLSTEKVRLWKDKMKKKKLLDIFIYNFWFDWICILFNLSWWNCSVILSVAFTVPVRFNLVIALSRVISDRHNLMKNK